VYVRIIFEIIQSLYFLKNKQGKISALMPGNTRAKHRQKVQETNANADAVIRNHQNPQSSVDGDHNSYFGDLIDVIDYEEIKYQEQLTKVQKLMPKEGKKPVESIAQEDISMSL
jgi:hypothetical protein